MTIQETGPFCGTYEPIGDEIQREAFRRVMAEKIFTAEQARYWIADAWREGYCTAAAALKLLEAERLLFDDDLMAELCMDALVRLLDHQRARNTEGKVPGATLSAALQTLATARETRLTSRAAKWRAANASGN